MTCMQVWDVRSNQLVQHYSAHSGPVTNVAFHPSGDFLLSSSLDTTLKVSPQFDATCASCAHQLKGSCSIHVTPLETPETARVGVGRGRGCCQQTATMQLHSGCNALLDNGLLGQCVNIVPHTSANTP